MKKLFRYFLNGLLLVLPVFATILVLYYSIVFVDGLVPSPIPGLGLVIVLGVTTLIGFLGKHVVFSPILKTIQKFIEKTPVINVIYKSTREFTEAFIGNERKFEKPILYDTSGNGTWRVGFLTQESLPFAGLENHVGVYIPHSYNFSGNFYIVPRTRIRPFEVSTTQAMRFAVTGGVVNLPAKQ